MRQQAGKSHCRVSNGDRQMLHPADRHNNPRGQGYRDHCALGRHRQGYITCPGHRSREKRVNRVASGDLVRFRHRKHGLVKGYAVLIKKQARVGMMHEGRQVSMKATDTMLLARNHGYRVSVTENIE